MKGLLLNWRRDGGLLCGHMMVAAQLRNGQGYTKVTICCLGWCSRRPHHSGQGSVGIREGQLLHVPAKVDLYKVGS
jgi:hypothetical protein